MVHISGGGGRRTPHRPNSASRKRASNGHHSCGRLARGRPASATGWLRPARTRGCACRTSAARMPWMLVGPTSRPGLISVLNSPVTWPSLLDGAATATSTTRSFHPVQPGGFHVDHGKSLPRGAVLDRTSFWSSMRSVSAVSGYADVRCCMPGPEGSSPPGTLLSTASWRRVTFSGWLILLARAYSAGNLHRVVGRAVGPVALHPPVADPAVQQAAEHVLAPGAVRLALARQAAPGGQQLPRRGGTSRRQRSRGGQCSSE